TLGLGWCLVLRGILPQGHKDARGRKEGVQKQMQTTQRRGAAEVRREFFVGLQDPSSVGLVFFPLTLTLSPILSSCSGLRAARGNNLLATGWAGANLNVADFGPGVVPGVKGAFYRKGAKTQRSARKECKSKCGKRRGAGR